MLVVLCVTIGSNDDYHGRSQKALVLQRIQGDVIAAQELRIIGKSNVILKLKSYKKWKKVQATSCGVRINVL